jgi:hypothetical protein
MGNNEDVGLQEGGSGDGSGEGNGNGGSGGGGADGGAGGGGDQLNFEGREPTFIDISNMEIVSKKKILYENGIQT